MHVIRFGELEASISYENGVGVRCGNQDTPQNSVNLMNIVRDTPPNIPVVKFLITKSQFLQYVILLLLLRPFLTMSRDQVA